MVTKKPIRPGKEKSALADLERQRLIEETGLDEDGDIPDEIEEDLYLAPDGTMTTYHEGDEDDPTSVWFGQAPTVTIAGVKFTPYDGQSPDDEK
jgi:hypothetical protein